jgi:signal transduction histidine kinase
VSIIVDNLVSNARRAKASRIKFVIAQPEKDAISILAEDNGQGISPKVDRKRIFEMGYTTTRGSGLGLYHVRHVLGEMGGSIELVKSQPGEGTSFEMKIAPGKRAK